MKSSLIQKMRKLATACIAFACIASPAQALEWTLQQSIASTPTLPPAPTFAPMESAAASEEFILPDELLAPTAAPAADIMDSAITDDGVLRVYLKSLAAPTNLTLTLDGVYTVEHDAGFRFERGTQIVLSDGGDRIYLSVGGLTIDMGPSLTLTRQASESEINGIYIAESEKNNLYMGDLSVSINENGGLRAVLAINMEDYLCGVVAYEMSDSWPIEALKAQAVAARTYAMQRKWNAGAKDYDVVDTTADQVYKGYDPDYTNVIEAVRATEGVVGTYKGGFATCYYTASNGGQTALANDIWGGSGDYGYLEMKDDPYDLENPKSMVASLSISADAHESAALVKMLQAGLTEAAAAAGMETEGLEFEEIVSIEGVNPKAEGSRMYTALRFTVRASAPVVEYAPSAADVGMPGMASESLAGNAALRGIDYLRRLQLNSPFVEVERREMLDQTFAVDISVYEQIKDELGLSLNGSDYELVSATATETGFTIEMRRFGHGVGMSQRGAQRMAGVHDFVYTDILSFYYPGMTLEKIAWATPELEALEDLPESVGYARPDPTPTPTPAPLPALQDGEYYATVTLDDASSSLNMRQQPTTQAPVVTQLSHGRRVIVSGEADAEGWVSVHTAEASGYVKLEYLIAD